MVDLTEALKAEPPGLLGRPAAASRTAAAKGPAPKPTFSMQRLRRLTLWGATAAAALMLAALSSRSEVAVERIALVLHRAKPAVAKPFDARAETERLAEAVRGLTANDEQIKSRLAAVEHDMDDVTGSITEEIKAAAASRHAEDGPSVAATAAVTASMAVPVEVPSVATAVPPATINASADTALPALPRTEFGVDVGSGLTIQALRLRWAALRTAHPQIFQDLEPIISVKEIPHSNRIELRLVAGPIAQPGAAAQLCAALARLGLFCQPTIFDGQHLALR